MGSCEYATLLIILSVSSYLEWGAASLSEELAAAEKYTPVEDIKSFLNKISSLAEGFGTDWTVFPDGNGTARVTRLQRNRSKGKVLTSHNFRSASTKVTFIYYRKDGDVRFHLKNIGRVPIKKNKKTMIIIHGWMSNAESSIVAKIRDAYVEWGAENIIAVDWSPIASDWFYLNAVEETELVGKVLANVIDKMVRDYELSYSNFHLIGHSLGAHIAGFAGKSTEEKIWRITGLDPALPGFQYIKGPEDRLNASDAEIVDVIHTCSGILGMSTPIGLFDFYPDGGTISQPGCDFTDILTSPQACSHSRALELYAASISDSAVFYAVRCEDWEHFKQDKCDGYTTNMGANLPEDTAPGVYYLRTKAESPFYLGNDGMHY